MRSLQAFLEREGRGGSGDVEGFPLDPNLSMLLSHEAHGSINGEFMDSLELQVRFSTAFRKIRGSPTLPA